MKRNDFSWMIGGVQGSGVDTSATIFARAAASGGLHVFGKREYYSNIKGEHSYFQVRVSTGPIHSHVDTVDMLATFEEETVFRHALEVRSEGAIIYDPDQDPKRLDQIPTIEANVKASLNAEFAKAGLSADIKGIVELARRRGVHIYPIPYNTILKDVGAKHGESSLSALQRMLNVVAVAASFALLGYDEEIVKASVRNHFRSKPKVAEMNVDAVGTTYDHVEKFAGSFSYKLSPTESDDVKLFVRGNSMVAMAKELAGC
ncbi:MAG: 2-oxoacid:acceptor oxidoreductase family protein, partial [Nitrososphaerota archaeon]|nr:2-oxoacid:acceptor oxidoreductase family protein [Nitrososphaerota archaeon]